MVAGQLIWTGTQPQIINHPFKLKVQPPIHATEVNDKTHFRRLLHPTSA
jgi:hypothetical protein